MASLSSTLLMVQQQLTRYVYSTYLIFGVTGGCFNILLFSQRQFRTISCCTYFIVASVLMLFNLGLGAGSLLYALDHTNPITTIVAFCRGRFYLLQCSAMVYRWCLVVACFDRYALSSTNARVRNFAQVYVARRVVIVIVLASFVSSVHMLVFYNIKAGACGIVYNVVASIYHSIFTIVMGSILPVLIMIVCALLIHHNLVRKRQRRQQNIGEPAERRDGIDHSQRKRDRQVLMMLLIQAIVFVILTTPLLTYNFYTAATVFVTNKPPDRLAIERLSAFLSEMMMLLFPASSFYLYTLVSQTFRAELIKVLNLTRICNRFINTRRIEPLTNGTEVRMAAGRMTTTRMTAQLPDPGRIILE